MGEIRSVTVYCSSSSTAREDLKELARDVGRGVAGKGWELVYGGAAIGPMGDLADGALEGNGRVVGVITDGLTGYEIAHTGLTRLEVVATMHERKRRFTELGDGFLVLPGGFGTLDELFEAVSWKQLQVHNKPVVLLNHRGFFDGLLAFLREAVAAGTIRDGHMEMIAIADDVESGLSALADGPDWCGPGERWWVAPEVEP